MTGFIKKKSQVKRAGKSGHRGGGRRRGVIAGGAHGVGKTRRPAAKSEPVRLNRLELSVFFYSVIGVHPREGAKVMKRPLHTMRNATMKVAIELIDARLKRLRKAETKKVLLGIKKKMQAVMQARAEQGQNRKKET